MKRQARHSVCWLGVVVSLVWASSVQAQKEMQLISYSNAVITVDGDASDWNLSQFGTFVEGGVTPFDLANWERRTGTGDIARLGWDDADENLYFGGMWTGAVLPENQADHSAKIYARHNATHQYFLVELTDDEINTGDADAWANDSVEFYFDPENNGGVADWNSEAQLVVDAGNQAQVWVSPAGYAAQVEAGVTSAVTITATGWLVEVGVDKSVFEPPLPADSNFGIDFSFRDNDDPNGTGNKGGDTAFTTAYDWADPTSSGGFPAKVPENWGELIAGVPPLATDLTGDGNVDAADAGVMFGEWGACPGCASDFNGDDFVDAADAGVMFGEWTGDLAPADSESASAEYNTATGELRMNVNGAVNVFVNSAGGLITPLAADPPGVQGLLTNNKNRVGMTNLSPINVSDFAFGSVGAGIPMEDLTLVYSPRLGGQQVTVPFSGDAGAQAHYIPEPASIGLIMLGLAGMLVARRRSQ